ncbi:MAG: helix-turn-helix domain-containing protein, partial [Thermodesulfobacteriota bacterium]
ALSNARGNRTKAARLLGLSRRSLLYKLKQYGLNKE